MRTFIKAFGQSQPLFRDLPKSRNFVENFENFNRKKNPTFW